MGNCIDPGKKKICDVKPVYNMHKEKSNYRDSKISNDVVPTYPSIEDVLHEQRVRKYHSLVHKRK